MTTSRRRFLKAGVMASLLAGFCLKEGSVAFGQKDKTKEKPPVKKKAPPQWIPDNAQRDEVFYFTKSKFDPYLNTEFTNRIGAITTRLTLVEIVDCAAGKGNCFVLIFKANRQLPESVPIITLQHSALGKFDLSLGKWKNFADPKGLYYQAVINHALE